jgi:hypothetical protein
MADEVAHALRTAESDAEINAALLRAVPFNTAAHQQVRDAVAAAKDWQRRRR